MSAPQWSDLPCPACKARSSSVKNSRGTRRDGIKRRRQCLACQHKWTTYERSDAPTREEPDVERAVRLLKEATKLLRSISGTHGATKPAYVASRQRSTSAA